VPAAAHHEIRGVHQHQGAEREQVGEVRREVGGGLDLQAQGDVAAPHVAEGLFAHLDGALGPAVLLALEAVHVRRELGGDDDVLEVDEFPAFELRAVAEVQIFREGVVLPAAAGFDGGPAPDAGGAVEVQEFAVAAAGRLLQHEVAVQKQGLQLGEEGEILVQVPPARLHHADFLVGEVVDHLLEVVRCRLEVGVENADVLALGGGHAFVQSAGLEAVAVRAVAVVDVVALGLQIGGKLLGVRGGFVRGIVQHLDLQAVARVVQGADGAQQVFHHVELVENGELHGDDGQFGELMGRHRHVHAVFPIMV